MSETKVGRVVTYVRQEAYTGPDRCWPCTILNVSLLVVVSIISIFLAPLVAGTIFLIGIAAIWLRGYLVPYTPQLTSHLRDVLHDGPVFQRTVTESVEKGAGTGTDTAIANDVIDALLAADILVADGEEVSLTPVFRDAWRAEMQTNRPYDLDSVADAMVHAIQWVDEASVVIDDNREWIRLTDKNDDVKNETWMTPPAAVADLTAVRTLDARTTLKVDQRTLVAPVFRQFLERCPVCYERLKVNSPRSCCGSPRYVAKGIKAVLACPACDEIVTVFNAEEHID